MSQVRSFTNNLKIRLLIRSRACSSEWVILWCLAEPGQRLILFFDTVLNDPVESQDALLFLFVKNFAWKDGNSTCIWENYVINYIIQFLNIFAHWNHADGECALPFAVFASEHGYIATVPILA